MRQRIAAFAMAATLAPAAHATNSFDGFDGTGGPNGSNCQQFAVATGWRTIGFEWRPTFVRWFNVSDSGVETEFRRVNTSISAPMQLMLNHWVGDNSAGAKNFVGQYNGGGGSASYDWVK